MTSKKPASPDEQPKRKIAQQVITEKRQYFVPAHGVSVEATSAQAAVSAAERATKKQEDGDAE